VSLHLDPPSLEPDDRVRNCAREQASQTRQAIRAERLPFCDKRRRIEAP
jgi:hypothetical protein